MQKIQNGQIYRLSVDPQTAQRLRQIATYHKRSEAAIIRDLVARQFSHDHDGILASIDKLADSDTDGAPE